MRGRETWQILRRLVLRVKIVKMKILVCVRLWFSPATTCGQSESTICYDRKEGGVCFVTFCHPIDFDPCLQYLFRLLVFGTG